MTTPKAGMPEPVTEQDLYTVAQFVGVAGGRLTAFLGVLKQAGLAIEKTDLRAYAAQKDAEVERLNGVYENYQFELNRSKVAEQEIKRLRAEVVELHEEWKVDLLGHTELLKAVGELAMAMGNPCVEANGDQTIESQTIREAVRRFKDSESRLAAMEANARRYEGARKVKYVELVTNARSLGPQMTWPTEEEFNKSFDQKLDAVIG